MATKDTMTFLIATAAVLFAFVGDKWPSSRVEGAPVAVQSGVTVDEQSTMLPIPPLQMHIFQEYTYDDLQDVNYTRRRPWQINQDVCPPVLCTALVTPTVSTSPVGLQQPIAPKLLSSQGATVGDVVDDKQLSVTIVPPSPAAAAVSFPFLEADIVLDPGVRFIHRDVFEKQMQLKIRPTRPPRRPSSASGGGKGVPVTVSGVGGNRPGQSSTDLVDGAGARGPRRKRAAVKRLSRLWPNGLVPYLIDKNLANETKESIRLAMIHFANYTCIRFRPKTASDVDYLFFIFQPGCWSSVGRIGGRQLISFGEGCEAFGTVVHEMSHALGFWHEQSRPDRDRYIKVVTQNIEASSLDQFVKREENETTSLGYAYDYHSIMHYGNNYYSTSEARTLVPIGIGRTLNMRIGQRKRLSDIDIAQLNALYSCYTNEAQKTACREGWVKFRSSCYKFEANVSESRSFYRAAEECRTQRAQLVAIDNKDEDAFIKSYLARYYPDSSDPVMWLTAGFVASNTSSKPSRLTWYVRGMGGNDVTMTYVADWSSSTNRTSPPTTGESIVLRRSIVEGGAYAVAQYEWDSVNMEMYLPSANRTSYPFICETKANITCHRSHNGTAKRGQDYRGRLSYTTEGHACQRWTKRYPHDHDLLTGDPKTDRQFHGLGDHNHCRNPNGMRKRPWCFTLLKAVKWQYCDVPLCTD